MNLRAVIYSLLAKQNDRYKVKLECEGVRK